MLKVILESFNVKVNTSTTWVTKTKHDVQKMAKHFLKILQYFVRVLKEGMVIFQYYA